MSIEIPKSSLEEWLSELKPYQKNALSQLLQTNEPTDVAKIWLISNGPQNTIPFGGVSKSNPFWENFLTEFNKFICDDNEYVKEKEELGKESPIIKGLIIATISYSIGEKIGFSATLLAPAITIMLATVGKLSINAYCKTISNSSKQY